MTHCVRRVLGIALFGLILVPSLALAAGVEALFNLGTPQTAPFPTDRFTLVDSRHLTRIRVNLPKPDCAIRPSDCADIDVINTLDGFNTQPRLSIPFSGAIDVSTVDSTTVFLVSLGDAVPGGPPGGKIVGINQIVWDPTSHTLHAESDEFLDQHTRYMLVVTNGIRDMAGDPVTAGDFDRFRRNLNFGQAEDAALKTYRKSLLDALELSGVAPDSVIAASVFTTQSTTAILEKIRNQIKATTPAPADFRLGTGGTETETVFPLSTVTDIMWNQQLSTTEPLTLTPSPVTALAVLQASVGTLAFGRYRSPDYETAGKFIPAVGTRTGVPAVQAMNDVYFNLFLPAGPPPLDGWPVAIFGHGFTNHKNSIPFLVASTMAAHGIATIAINVVGHGFGAAGTLVVGRLAEHGGPVTLPAGGRGIDQNGDTVIGSTEGSSAAPPNDIISSRDGLRQTVVDLMQLTRVIETGGIPGLDRDRIYYFGQSFGGIYGTIFLGVEPSVRLGVPNVPGGSIVEIALRSPVFRPLLASTLATRQLLNGQPGTLQFIDSLPLRDQPPVVSPAAGAMAIQRFIDNAEWVAQSGNPVAYAPHLRKDPLAGMTAKSVIIQFATGDQTVPNPTTSSILRAGDLADRATYYRNDLAFAGLTGIPKDPHAFLLNVVPPGSDRARIALAAQIQIAQFFASELFPGATPFVIDPDTLGLVPIPVFEVPIVPPLPETLNFIP